MKSLKVKKGILLPVIMTAVMAVIFLFTKPGLSAAGDLNISEFLASPEKIRPGYFYISSTLTVILRFLNKLFLANWWSIFSVAVMFLCAFTLLRFVDRKFEETNHILRLSASIITCMLLWETVIRNGVNFSQTAAMAGLTAMLMLLDLIGDAMSAMILNKKTIIRMIAVVIMYLLSAGIRMRIFAIVIAFSAVLLAYIFVVPYEASGIVESLKCSFKRRKRVLLGVAALMVSVVMSLLIGQIEYVVDPGVKEWVTSNGYRSDISDYPERYIPYDEEPELYDGLGLKSSWIEMVYSFVSSDTSQFNSRNLRKMVETRQPATISFASYKESFEGHGMLAIVIVLIVAGTIALRGFKKTALPLVGSAFVFAALSAFFMMIGRYEWRVTSPCILLCLTAFLAMSFDRDFSRAGNDLYLNSCLIIFAALLVVTEGIMIADEKGVFVSPKAAVEDERQAHLLEFINNDRNMVYLYTDMARYSTSHTMWSAHKPDYLNNYFPLTAMFIQGCSDKLREYGITNLYSDMLERSDIRLIYERAITYDIYPYLKDYYDPYIGISCLGTYEGYELIRYSRQRLPDEVNEIAVETVVTEHEGPENDQFVRTAYDVVCAYVNPADAVYDDYVINFKDKSTGEVYSYGMNHNKIGVYGTVWCMKETWSPSVTEATLNGIDSEGNITELADITSGFEGILGSAESE